VSLIGGLVDVEDGPVRFMGAE